MIKNKQNFRPGITLVELMIGVACALIVIMTAGLVLVSGHRNWIKTYKYAYGDVQVNAVETMLAFGKTGRLSNKSDYVLYDVSGNTFNGPVTPPVGDPEAVVSGEAVEFRYWDTDLSLMDADEQKAVMKTDVTGNAYALFYVNNGVLRVDRGTYDPATGIGGVGASGQRTNPSSTQILAKNVQSVQFSHTTKNTEGEGQGCIKLELSLYDPVQDEGITVKTATLMRNVWP
jgi:hypothetical protein